MFAVEFHVDVLASGDTAAWLNSDELARAVRNRLHESRVCPASGGISIKRVNYGTYERTRDRHRSRLCGFYGFSASHTPEQVRNYIDAQIEQLRAEGFEADSCLIDLGATAEQVATTALQAKGFDCVVIGAGLRQPPLRLPLFEKVINLVHTLAPKVRICFNTTPANTVEAVRRWVEPRCCGYSVFERSGYRFV